jgi:hypothetical protein
LKTKILVGIIATLIVIAFTAISWIATCGVIKLISMCFGFEFTWKLATGAWLVLLVLRSIFKVTVNK